MNNYLRRDLKNFKPYKVNEVSHKIKLDANESPYNLDEEFKVDLIEWLIKNENFNRYPDTNNKLLRKSISNYWNVNIDNVICGVGSDQLIDCIMKLFIEPNDKVLLPNPSFSMYTLATKLNHGIPIYFELQDDYSYDIQDIINTVIKENPKILFLCSPNNPTGNIISNANIIKMLKIIKCPIVIDEAYGEFTDSTVISQIKDYKNVIVLRTLSKAYGLAGLRVGYGIADQELINMLGITKPPYNLNTFSQVVATKIFNNSKKYNKRIKKIRQEKDWLYTQLTKVNKINCFPSEANFFLVECQVQNLDDILREKGILIKAFNSDNRLKDCYRISVGTREENNKLLYELNSL